MSYHSDLTSKPRFLAKVESNERLCSSLDDDDDDDDDDLQQNYPMRSNGEDERTNEPIGIVDGIAKARRVDDGQSELNAFLLQDDRR